MTKRVNGNLVLSSADKEFIISVMQKAQSGMPGMSTNIEDIAAARYWMFFFFNADSIAYSDLPVEDDFDTLKA